MTTQDHFTGTHSVYGLLRQEADLTSAPLGHAVGNT